VYAFAPRRQVDRHPERELRFGDAHAVGTEGHLRTRLEHPLTKQAAGKRAIDVDVPLPRHAGRRDLPAEERVRAAACQGRLHRVAVRARARPDRFGQRRHPPAVAPVLPHDVCC
jgi:hypothetical protein